MDHRWNERLPLRLDIEVRYPKHGDRYTPASSRDISKLGMYIELATKHMRIQINTFVTIRIRQHLGIDISPIELPAVVSRSGSDGIGLMFVDLESHDHNRFIELMHAQDLHTRRTPTAPQPQPIHTTAINRPGMQFSHEQTRPLKIDPGNPNHKASGIAA